MKSYYDAGSNITLSCYVTNTSSTLVDIDAAINIKWTSQKENLSESSVHSYNENFTHILTNAALSYAGNYNCTCYLNSTTDNPYIKPSDVRTGVTNVTIKSEYVNYSYFIDIDKFLVPNGVSPSITQLNSYYSFGDSIILICSVLYPYFPLIDITTNVNIQWLNSSNHTLHSYTGINNYTQHTISYTINNVSLSDAGQYICQYNVSSTNHSFVLSSDNMRASVNVSVKSKVYYFIIRSIYFLFLLVPIDKIPVISLIPHQSVFDAGSNITLSCSVTYPYSSLIDIDAYLTLQWFNSSNHTLSSSTIINDYNEHTLNYTISNARLSDAGQYSCSSFINTSVSHIATSTISRNFIIINIKSKKYL